MSLTNLLRWLTALLHAQSCA